MAIKRHVLAYFFQNDVLSEMWDIMDMKLFKQADDVGF